MYYLSNLISKAVVSVADGTIIGTLENAIFQKNLSRVKYFKVYTDASEKDIYLPPSYILNADNDAIMVKGKPPTVFDETDFICPLRAIMVSHEGCEIDVVSDIALTDNFMTLHLCGKETAEYKIDSVISFSSNTVIISDNIEIVTHYKRHKKISRQAEYMCSADDTPNIVVNLSEQEEKDILNQNLSSKIEDIENSALKCDINQLTEEEKVIENNIYQGEEAEDLAPKPKKATSRKPSAKKNTTKKSTNKTEYEVDTKIEINLKNEAEEIEKEFIEDLQQSEIASAETKLDTAEQKDTQKNLVNFIIAEENNKQVELETLETIAESKELEAEILEIIQENKEENKEVESVATESIAEITLEEELNAEAIIDQAIEDQDFFSGFTTLPIDVEIDDDVKDLISESLEDFTVELQKILEEDVAVENIEVVESVASDENEEIAESLADDCIKNIEEIIAENIELQEAIIIEVNSIIKDTLSEQINTDAINIEENNDKFEGLIAKAVFKGRIIQPKKDKEIPMQVEELLQENIEETELITEEIKSIEEENFVESGFTVNGKSLVEKVLDAVFKPFGGKKKKPNVVGKFEIISEDTVLKDQETVLDNVSDNVNESQDELLSQDITTKEENLNKKALDLKESSNEEVQEILEDIILEEEIIELPPEPFVEKEILVKSIVPQFNHLVGRKVTQDVYNSNAEIIAHKNTVITLKTIDDCRKYGKLLHLARSCKPIFRNWY